MMRRHRSAIALSVLVLSGGLAVLILLLTVDEPFSFFNRRFYHDRPSPIGDITHYNHSQSLAHQTIGLNAAAANWDMSWEAPFCVENAKHDHCCDADHCTSVVQKSTLYSKCCDNLPDKESDDARSTVYPLLVTSTPHSGTVFFHILLNQLGIPVVNEHHSPNKNDHYGMVSWMHAVQEHGYLNLGPTSGHATHLHSSKFRAMWHLVRDPLHALTYLTFTEPIWGKSHLAQEYQHFLERHLNNLLNDTALLVELGYDPNILGQLHDQHAHPDLYYNNPNATVTKIDDEMRERIQIHRGMEFFLQWHGFLNDLHLPVIRMEDLVLKRNLTILDELFESIGQPPPNHETAWQMILKEEHYHYSDHGNNKEEEAEAEEELDQEVDTTDATEATDATDATDATHPTDDDGGYRLRRHRQLDEEEHHHHHRDDDATGHGQKFVYAKQGDKYHHEYNNDDNYHYGNTNNNPSHSGTASVNDAKYHVTKHPILQWGDLCRVSPAMTRQFLELSQSFAYYLDEEPRLTVQNVCSF